MMTGIRLCIGFTSSFGGPVMIEKVCRFFPSGGFQLAHIPAKPSMSSPFNLMKYGSRVATCHSKKPSAGIRQRRSAKLRLNFAATVSAREFIILLPIFGSFAHPGTRPHFSVHLSDFGVGKGDRRGIRLIGAKTYQ